MTVQQVNEKFASMGIKARLGEFPYCEGGMPIYSCGRLLQNVAQLAGRKFINLIGDEMQFTFAPNLTPPITQKIMYSFSSGVLFDEVIATVSNQFGPTSPYPYGVDWRGPIEGDILHAWWDLGDGLRLRLISSGPSHPSPYPYWLILEDDGITQRDKIEQQNKLHSINSSPKF
jgi:hypothetical protein